jgi:hypothetical protein
VIEFANGKALVAESGSASLSASVIDLFQGRAAVRKIEDEMTIAKIAEESVREIRNSLTLPPLGYPTFHALAPETVVYG